MKGPKEHFSSFLKRVQNALGTGGTPEGRGLSGLEKQPGMADKMPSFSAGDKLNNRLERALQTK